MRHDSFISDMTPSCETWLIHMRHDSFIWYMTHIYETWLPHVRHDSYIWDMTPWYQKSFIPPKKPIRSGASTHIQSLVWFVPLTPNQITFPICTTNEWAGVDIRWVPVDGFETRWIPKKIRAVKHDSYIWEMNHTYETWLIQNHIYEIWFPLWVPHSVESCLIHMRHDSFVWDMTHSYEMWLIHMRHESFIWDVTHSYETWIIHMRHESFIWHSYETWLIHMRHDSFIWDMTHSYETWLIHMRHDSTLYDTQRGNHKKGIQEPRGTTKWETIKNGIQEPWGNHRKGIQRYIYGVATVSRIDKIIVLFCRTSSLL